MAPSNLYSSYTNEYSLEGHWELSSPELLLRAGADSSLAAYPVTFWRSYSIAVCLLLTASSNSSTWLRHMSTSAHLSQVRPLIPANQGRGSRHFLHTQKPIGCVLPLELCPSGGLSCAGDSCFSQCWGLSPVAPHDHFCLVPCCLQYRFLPPCHANCPLNC